MRESKVFAERTKAKATDETLKKYFLVYEGIETEVLYFDAINDLRQQIGINPIIELRPLIRSYSEENWSNPKKILDRVICNLEESAIGKITYETLCNRVMDYFYDQKIITTSKVQAKALWSTLQWICLSKLEKSLYDCVDDVEKVCSFIMDLLQHESKIENVVTDISEIIKNQKITYEEGFDKICLIVDRDKESFVANPDNNQYEYVYNTCKKKNFGFFITNPCFEFWLLLHFDEVFSLDKEQLLENSKVTAKRRYAEHQLHSILPGYKKSSYDAHELIMKVDKAIANEKTFCEDAAELKNTVGSNVGLLISEMRK